MNRMLTTVLDEAEQDHQTMTISIPLEVDFSSALIISEDELFVLRDILSRMRDRDFNIKLPGWKFGGVLRDFTFHTNIDTGTPELSLSVSL